MNGRQRMITETRVRIDMRINDLRNKDDSVNDRGMNVTCYNCDCKNRTVMTAKTALAFKCLPANMITTMIWKL